MHLKSFSNAEYLAAKVSPAIARFASASAHPIPNFDIFAAPVDWDYFIPEEAVDVVPLWSSNADGYLRWIRHGRTEFVFVSHECQDWWIVAYSEQGVLADLYHRYSESFQWVDEKIDQAKCDAFAVYIGFTLQEEADRLLVGFYDHFESWIKKVP
jgi:hypothetical protein